MNRRVKRALAIVPPKQTAVDIWLNTMMKRIDMALNIKSKAERWYHLQVNRRSR